MPRRPTNLTDRRFGHLVARALCDERLARYAAWECRCDCGNTTTKSAQQLQQGYAMHCGCMAESKKALMRMPEYQIWKGIKKRCSPNGHHRRYAGRGIAICDRWMTSFESFYADMGPRPSAKHSVDRINNDGHYEPGNCRWATETEQKRNFSRNRVLTFRGESHPASRWCEITGLRDSTLCARLDHGWSVECALTTPPQKRRRHASTSAIAS